MSKILELIVAHKWEDILTYVSDLKEEERLALQKELVGIDYAQLDNNNGFELTGKAREHFFDNRVQNIFATDYAKLVSTRSLHEFEAVYAGNSMGKIIFGSSREGFEIESRIRFFEKFPFKDFDKIRNKLFPAFCDFEVLWIYHKKGWINFDEAFYIESLFAIEMFKYDTQKLAAFLMENSETLTNLLFKFYKYELRVLDISKWESRDGFQCKKIHHFWTEIFLLLIENGIIFPRDLITNLLESLLNHWKKPHLDWHIQIIKLLEPTLDEYLANQDLLFAFLNSDNNTVVNYSLQVIKEIHKHEMFDFHSFVGNLSRVFTNEKLGKGILSALKIIDDGLIKNQKLKTQVSAVLSEGLVQSNSDLQAEFAIRLKQNLSAQELIEIVAPYNSVLKTKALEILNLETEISKEDIDFMIPTVDRSALFYPSNWETLLQSISQTIRTKLPADLDILVESIKQLQDQIPPDYKKQLSSYTKQLSKNMNDDYMRHFADFYLNWVNQSAEYFETEAFNETRLPFLKYKLMFTYELIKKGSKLPLLSTPTHQPCFVHPERLVDRLLVYQAEGVTPDLYDLTMACNRLLKDVSPQQFLDKIKKLEGFYASAVQYLVGFTDKFVLDKEILESISENDSTSWSILHFWAQIARTKHVDGTFDQFKGSEIEHLPSVISPFKLNFDIESNTSGEYTWRTFNMDQQWNLAFREGNDYTLLLYSHTMVGFSDTSMIYQASLVPNYIDPLLCSYTSSWSNTEGINDAPLKFILEYQLPVYHSGWYYVANCLLTKNKETCRLAADYIQMSCSTGILKSEILAHSVAKMIVDSFTPVKRLTDYIEQSENNHSVKKLHYEIVANCIELLNLTDIPRSFQKIINLYLELLKDLKLDVRADLEEIIRKIKK